MQQGISSPAEVVRPGRSVAEPRRLDRLHSALVKLQSTLAKPPRRSAHNANLASGLATRADSPTCPSAPVPRPPQLRMELRAYVRERRASCRTTPQAAANSAATQALASHDGVGRRLSPAIDAGRRLNAQRRGAGGTSASHIGPRDPRYDYSPGRTTRRTSRRSEPAVKAAGVSYALSLSACATAAFAVRTSSFASICSSRSRTA